MSESNAAPSPADAADDATDELDVLAEIESEVELLSELLVHEFSAVERAAAKLREASPAAKDLAASDLLHVLSKLRLSRAIDDFTTIYLDIKDDEALAARELLDELGDDDDDRFDELDFEDDLDEFEDDLDEEFEDDFDDESSDDFGNLGDASPKGGAGS